MFHQLLYAEDPQTPAGFEEALKSMYRGERSFFTVLPDYGYGLRGCADKGEPCR